MGETARKQGAKQMIFDWHKAAQLIKERKPKTASAGLHADWEYTGGDIYTAEKGPLSKEDTDVYLSSNWATPELDLDGNIIPCYITEEDNPNAWNADTVWPESALAILNYQSLGAERPLRQFVKTVIKQFMRILRS